MSHFPPQMTSWYKQTAWGNIQPRSHTQPITSRLLWNVLTFCCQTNHKWVCFFFYIMSAERPQSLANKYSLCAVVQNERHHTTNPTTLWCSLKPEMETTPPVSGSIKCISWGLRHVSSESKGSLHSGHFGTSQTQTVWLYCLTSNKNYLYQSRCCSWAVVLNENQNMFTFRMTFDLLNMKRHNLIILSFKAVVKDSHLVKYKKQAVVILCVFLHFFSGLETGLRAVSLSWDTKWELCTKTEHEVKDVLVDDAYVPILTCRHELWELTERRKIQESERKWHSSGWLSLRYLLMTKANQVVVLGCC